MRRFLEWLGLVAPKPVEHDLTPRIRKSQVLDFDIISSGLYVRGVVAGNIRPIEPGDIMILRTYEGRVRYAVIEVVYDSRMVGFYNFKAMRETEFIKERTHA